MASRGIRLLGAVSSSDNLIVVTRLLIPKPTRRCVKQPVEMAPGVGARVPETDKGPIEPLLMSILCQGWTDSQQWIPRAPAGIHEWMVGCMSGSILEHVGLTDCYAITVDAILRGEEHQVPPLIPHHLLPGFQNLRPAVFWALDSLVGAPYVLACTKTGNNHNRTSAALAKAKTDPDGCLAIFVFVRGIELDCQPMRPEPKTMTRMLWISRSMHMELRKPLHDRRRISTNENPYLGWIF